MKSKRILFGLYFICVIILLSQILVFYADNKKEDIDLYYKGDLKEVVYSNKDTIEFMAELNYTPSKVIPFWFWNGDLNKEEITRQINLIQDVGITEVIIHARSGLEQDYLGEEWFEMVGYALSELEKRNMRTWIYDDFDWPSGIANGKILEQRPDLIAKKIKFKKIDSESFYLESKQRNSEKIISVIDAKKSKINNIKEKYCTDNYCDFGEDYFEGEFYVFYQDEEKSYWTEFENEYYVDLLNPETTQMFIDLTHEEYYKRFKPYFGTTLIGFFTDEPGIYTQLHSSTDVNSISWSDYFTDYFKNMKGYDLTDYLYYVWEEDQDISKKIKIDYFEVRTELYVKNYFETIHNWTQSHKVLLTGHVLIEENLYDIVSFQGDFFKPMQYLDIPGTDEILVFNEEKITPLMVSSAEFLYNKPYSLTETFGGYGKSLTYDDVLSTTDWLLDKGIDIIVLHAFFYTTEGELQKKDYQPSLFFQNEKLWPYMGEYTEYVNSFNNKEKEKVVIIYPLKKAWSLFNPNNREKVDELDNLLKETIEKEQNKGKKVILVPDYLIE